jgi:hypothetical protein
MKQHTTPIKREPPTWKATHAGTIPMMKKEAEENVMKCAHRSSCDFNAELLQRNKL